MAADLETRRDRLETLFNLIPTKGVKSFHYKRTKDHTHQGVDIGAPRGTPIEAPLDGTVTHASDQLEEGFAGYGRHVVVRQGEAGPWLLFAHLEDVNVEPGQVVAFGDLLGTVGDSCFDRSDPAKACKGTHAHIEVSPGSYPQGSEARRLDPAIWITEQYAALAESTTKKKKKKKKKKPGKLAKKGMSGGAIGVGVGVVVSLLIVLGLAMQAIKANKRK